MVRPLTTLWYSALALGLFGCTNSTLPRVDAGFTKDAGVFIAVERPPPFEIPRIDRPPALDLLHFPIVSGAQRLLIDVAAARLEVDPTASDALTGLGACVDQVVYCFKPGTRTLGDCLDATRACRTSTPWTEEACCPEACKVEFATRAAQGEAALETFEHVFFTTPDCFPGVRAALEVQ
jgi:hypothetical protein